MLTSPFQNLLSEPSRKMNKLFYSFMKADEKNNEYEQGLYRIIFSSLLLIYWAISYLSISKEIVQFCSVYLFVSILFLMNIIVNPQPVQKRLWISMISDVLATSYAFYLTSEAGGILIGVYLLLIIGYGLRYGQALLKGTVLAGLIGFSTAVYFSDFWQLHIQIVCGVIITLLLVSFHVQGFIKQLKLAVDRAQFSDQAKNQLLSYITHEIDAPLKGIVGACDSMTTPNLDKEQMEALEIIRSSSELLSGIVSNVSDLTKIESVKIAVQTTSFNMETLIDKTIGLFRVQCDHKNIEISYEIDSDTPVLLKGDPEIVKQILINLIGNSINFTEKGSVKLKVRTIVQTATKAKLRIEILDSGMRCSENSLNNSLEGSSQGIPSAYRSSDITIETTISNQLVQLLEGSFGIENEDGLGIQFWFEIPFEKQGPDEILEEKDKGTVIAFKDYYNRPPQKRSFTILVADHNQTSGTLLTQLLEEAGHRVELVKDGEDALDILEDNEFDLMILDSDMPKMNGLDVMKLHNVLTIGRRRTPTIIIGVDANPSSIQNAHEEGADACFTRSFDSALFLETVNNLGTNLSGNVKANVLPYAKKIMADSNINEQFVNQSRLSELSKLDRKDRFFEDMLNGFIIETESRIEKLDSYLKEKDYRNLNYFGHAIAGSASSIGLDVLVSICNKIDAIKPSDDFTYAKSLVKEAKVTFERSKSQLLDYLHKYQMVSM